MLCSDLTLTKVPFLKPFECTFLTKRTGYTQPVQGIASLRDESIDEVMKLEENLYRDYPKRAKGREKMQRYMHAALETARHFSYSSLCYESRTIGGHLDGFVLSLVGDALNTANKKYAELLLKVSGGTRCIYVCDWSAEPKSVAGTALVRRFFQDYTTDFIMKGDMLPIIAEHRLSGSYTIIKNHVHILKRIMQRTATDTSFFNTIELTRYEENHTISLSDASKRVVLVPSLI